MPQKTMITIKILVLISLILSIASLYIQYRAYKIRQTASTAWINEGLQEHLKKHPDWFFTPNAHPIPTIYISNKLRE